MRMEKHADGFWHVRVEAVDATLCGRRRELQKQGRPAKTPTCATCLVRLPLAPVSPAPTVTSPRVAASGKADPAVRGDGRCAVCEKPRLPGRSKRYATVEAERDPFCSTKCCRQFHGLVDRFDDDHPGDGRQALDDHRLQDVA